MAYGNVINFFKLWTQDDQESERKMKKLLLTGLDTVAHKGSDVLSKIKVGPPVANPVVRWMEEIEYPYNVKVTFVNSTATVTIPTTHSIMGTAVTANAAGGALIKQIIRLGTILEQPSSGAQMKADDITGLSTGNTFTVAAYGGTSLPSDVSTAETWDIIGEPWSDYTDAGDPRGEDRFFREVGTQIHAETFELPKTRENTRYELVANETEHQIAALLRKMRRSLGLALLRARPYNGLTAPKWGTQVQDPTMCGLTIWPEIINTEAANTNVYKDLSNKKLKYTDLNRVAKYHMIEEAADYDVGNWVAIVHPNLFEDIQSWEESYRRKGWNDTKVGPRVDTIFLNTVGKEVGLISDKYQRSSLLTLVNLSAASYGYYVNDKLDRKELETQGRYRRWLISFQTYGVVLRNPRTNIAQIKNIKTN